VMEYWNVGFSKEFTHFLTSLSSVILAISHCPISPEPIIPSLQYSDIRNILDLLKLPLVFIKGHISILGETHEHGDGFFYIMPSHRGPQRAASNHVHEQLVIVFYGLCACVLRLCSGP